MSRTKELVSEEVDVFDNLIVDNEPTHQTLIIIGELAKLNEHDNANRINRFVGAKLKKDMTETVSLQASPLKPITKPAIMRFHWYISSKHDPDNVAFAKKYILDGLIHAQKLPNDNQQWIHGFSDSFHRISKGNEKIIIDIEDSELVSI